ncbi:ribonuclease H-like domain-containing protein [Tanacetum coccineum]
MQKTILKQQYDNFTTSRSEELDKTYDRFQKLIRQLDIHGEVISHEDANLKLLRSLPLAWNNIALIMRNKSDLDTMSMDDLYNNLKVYEVEIKSQTSSSLNSQNVAFVSLKNTSNTNEAVYTAHEVSTSNSQGQASSSSYVDDVMFSFFVNQSNSQQLDNEDLEQIDTNDLVYMDLNDRRGHFARECRAIPKNQGDSNRDAPRRNVPVETPTNALVVQDGLGGYDWSFQAKEGPTNFALMAFSSSSSSSNNKYDQQRDVLNKANLEIIAYQLGIESLEARIVVHQKNDAVFEEDIAFLKYDVKVRDHSIIELKNQLEEALKEKDNLKLKLEKFETSSKKLTELINSQISVNNKTVPPPYTGNYMPSRHDLSFAGLDDYVYKTNVSETITNVPRNESTASKSSKDNLKQPKDVRPNALIIEEWESDSDDDCVIRPSFEQNKPSYAKINFVKSDENTRISVIEQHTNRQAENLRKSQCPRVDKRNWNGLMTQKLVDGFEFNKKACFVCGSLNHLIKDCNFYENKMVGKSMLNNMGRVTGQREVRPVWNNAQRVNHQNKLTRPHHKRNFVPTAVLTKYGNVPVNTAKQSSLRATAVSNSTTKYVNTAASRLTVNGAKPSSNVFHKSHSSVKRTIYQRTAPKNSNFKEKVNTAKVNNVTTIGTKAVVSVVQGHKENVVKSSACWIWRPTRKLIDYISKDSGSYMPKRFDYGNPQYALQDQGIFDSRCSRHIIGNKSYLTDYQDIDGGFVAFARSPKGGKITRKGKIRTGKLDFKDVYFVKELKFNLFSVSQMCDKKNNVLFTETECLVLSPDFKLLDESQVLLKVSRQNNMYNFDLKNVVPSGGETLLEAYLQSFLKMTILVLLVRRESNTKPLAEAVNTACYVHNRVLVTKPHNKTPYELLLGRPPSISFMRPFGCLVTILNTLDPLGKFDGKADEGFLVGYSINSKAFMVFNTRTRKVEENLHINFLENKPTIAKIGPEWLFDIDSLKKSMNYKPVIAGNQTNGDADNKDVDEKEGYANNTNRVSTVNPSVSAAGQGFDNADDQERIDSSTQDVNTARPSINTAIENINTGSSNINTASLIPNDLKPKKVIQALTDPSWIEARQEELLQFKLQKVWTLVDLSKDKRAIGTKWVYRKKKDERGIVVRNKARLIAQGYTQEEGIDYDEVFAPVASVTTMT